MCPSDIIPVIKYVWLQVWDSCWEKCIPLELIQEYVTFIKSRPISLTHRNLRAYFPMA